VSVFYNKITPAAPNNTAANPDTGIVLRAAAPVNDAGVAPVPVPLTPNNSPLAVALGIANGGAAGALPCTATVSKLADPAAPVALAISSVRTLDELPETASVRKEVATTDETASWRTLVELLAITSVTAAPAELTTSVSADVGAAWLTR
jgi:hypothetical protein